MTHPIRARLIAEGHIKPAAPSELHVSHEAVQRRQREAGPTARALAILEATIKRPSDKPGRANAGQHRPDKRVW